MAIQILKVYDFNESSKILNNNEGGNELWVMDHCLKMK
jgi:hypothetical protein